MADTTGIQAVFEAWRKQNKIEGSLKLPGFEEFTEEQLYFISFAAVSRLQFFFSIIYYTYARENIISYRDGQTFNGNSNSNVFLKLNFEKLKITF